MGNGSNGLDKLDGKLSPRSTVLVAIVSSILGATGGHFLMVRFAPDSLRPDPFTGAQGRSLERRLEKLERHVEYHPDLTNRFDARISTLEAQNKLILLQLDRIEKQLDQH